ncbi:MAG: exopolysaccharide biosynthesis polyprenyl glycosylphosphotransferase [Flavobacteriales bacterium]|nr:exopolysaccharide biosynthesis polyprenyl glycosylphosphotransferase [Flavobacteriales bacterium]
MSRNAGIYINYFLTTMLVDCSIILLTFTYFYGFEKLGIQVTLLLFGGWLLVNILNYSSSNRRYISFVHTYYESIIPFTLFTVFYLGYLELFYPDWHFSIPFVGFFAVLFSGILLGKALFVAALRVYRNKGYGYSNYVLVGPPEANLFIQNLFENRVENGYRFVQAITWENFHTSFGNLKNLIEEGRVDEVYCYAEHKNEEQLAELIKYLDELKINTYLIPFDHNKHIQFSNFRKINGDNPTVILKGPLERMGKRAIKRLFDVVFSLLVIVLVLSWLLPILMILIKLDSRGPAFFVQKRAGKFGAPYTCYKLRTMVPNADANLKQATKNDQRVTKFGRFLRNASLDELPQFFNVLMGNMSVVGPRPHIESLNKKFGPEIPFYNERFNVKPGITGLSQVWGYRGETPTIEVMKRRVDTDRLYVQNWTLLLDLRIIYHTTRKTLQFNYSEAY